MNTEMALPTQDSIKALFRFEDTLKRFPAMDMPIQHFHIQGVYVRRIFMPAGSCVVSRVHKYDNVTLILFGSCVVYQNGERWHLQAGDVFKTEAGTKRALYMLEDCIWATVHNNEAGVKDEAEILEFLTTNDESEAVALISKEVSQ